MAFDAAAYSPATPVAAPQPSALAEDLCPIWTAQNPDRALAFLFVAPQDGVAVDVLVAL